LDKPIITTDVTGSIDLLQKYGKISIVPAGVVGSIEEALRNVLQRNEMIAHPPIDLTGYLWQDVAKQLISHFNEIEC